VRHKPRTIPLPAATRSEKLRLYHSEFINHIAMKVARQWNAGRHLKELRQVGEEALADLLIRFPDVALLCYTKRIRGAMQDFLRKERRHPQLPVDALDREDKSPLPDAVIERSETIRQFEKAVHDLPQPDRRLIELLRSGLNQTEAGRAMKPRLSQPQVSKMKARAICAMRPLLAICI
jgi:RNA polymerase sigma factor (sigma-70 family)